jgi:hypothetical protein
METARRVYRDRRARPIGEGIIVDNSSVAAGDPFAYAGQKRHGDFEHIGEVVRRTHTDLLTAIREEQAHLGRHMTDSELDGFARRFYADEYRRDLRGALAAGGDEPDEDG